MQQISSFLGRAWAWVGPHAQRFGGWYRTQSRRMQWIVGGVAVVGLLACCGALSNLGSPSGSIGTVAVSATATHAPTKVVSVATATPQAIHYPPVTKADLQGLAAMGDASAVHEFHAETVGAAGVCPEAKREVTVDPSLTGKQLAEDLLAYFYAQSLDNPCGSLVLAYHSQSEGNDTYTAGRIDWTVTDASGTVNLDPNATNLTYVLTLDTGDLTSGQEYTVKY